jgi:DNA-binding PadR family transcriptional regulator
VLALLSYQPLHPYGIRRLIKQWGKDDVVNVGQPASLYRIIERLLDAGLIRIRDTERDQRYPERTVYEVTEEGRRLARHWLNDMISAPVSEFPQFPAALSFAMMLTPAELAFLFDQRMARLRQTLTEVEESLRGDPPLPRITLLDDEYRKAVTLAELNWLRGALDDLKAGRFTWNYEELIRYATAQEPLL